MFRKFLGGLVLAFCAFCFVMFARLSWNSVAEHDFSMVGTGLFFVFLGGVVGAVALKAQPPEK
jgi:hypothetical protein